MACLDGTLDQEVQGSSPTQTNFSIMFTLPVKSTGRVRIDRGWGFNPPVPLFIPLWPTNPLVPAVLLTLPVHFSQFEPCRLGSIKIHIRIDLQKVEYLRGIKYYSIDLTFTLLKNTDAITKESCNWIEIISVALYQMTPLKVPKWLHSRKAATIAHLHIVPLKVYIPFMFDCSGTSVSNDEKEMSQWKMAVISHQYHSISRYAHNVWTINYCGLANYFNTLLQCLCLYAYQRKP